MLSICFVDTSRMDFDGATPARTALGGTQSAVCYLAAELAVIGHRIAVAASTSTPGTYAAVEYVPISVLDGPFLSERDFDVVVFVNGPARVSSMRASIPARSRLVMWTGHAADQPAMQELKDRELLAGWDRILCVSNWQRKQFQKELGVEPHRAEVVRNAIAPAFENLFASREALRQAKKGPLRLTYTSTPFRGLDVLLQIFPGFRAKHPGASLDIYSSMAVYQIGVGSDDYRQLYEIARSMPAVRYLGSIPQAQLARSLAGTHILSYPNTFPETSCIAVMEALAAGLRVVTTELGALPETTGGFARLVPPAKDKQSYAASYRKALAAPYDLESETERAYDQVLAMNRACTWAIRAREWEEVLGRLTNGDA